ncbi:MAG: hypothetical protein KJ587_01495 [Alphaproteobacteria bacterium]|nr:hypothetical protein [Alphaproteobacteria bacterium]
MAEVDEEKGGLLQRMEPELQVNPFRADAMTVTCDEEEERHLVSTETLDRLAKGGKDMSLEWSLLLAGAGSGFVQNVFVVIGKMPSSQQANNIDIILAMACIGCFAGAFAKYTEHQKTKTDTDELLRKMKERKKVSLP